MISSNALQRALGGEGFGRRPLGRLLLMALASLAGVGHAAEQSSWEYSPYRVAIWLATSAAPELSDRVREDAQAALAAGAEAAAGAAWDVVVSPPPAVLESELAIGLESLATDRIEAAAREVLSDDKLELVVVTASDDGFRIRVRELDCLTRQWGSVRECGAGQPLELADAALTAVLDAFRPLVRIEDVQGGEATARIRAGGLIVRPSSPAQVEAGAVLQPILRRNDRNGQPLPGGVRAIPWTFLAATARDGFMLQCRVYSAMRRPFGGRAGSRTQRYALAAKPTRPSTLVRLESLDDPPQPLVGYELYATDPFAADPTPGNARLKLVGRTDWRGEIDVLRRESLLRILYVKNGERILARLPLVPGLDPRQTARLPNDDLRMEVEAYIRGFQNTVMDLAVRRELLATRIQQRIKEGKTDEARKLIDQLRQVPTRVELSPLLSQQRQRYTTPDKRLQEKIDQLFRETEAAMTKYLDPSQADEFARQLAKNS